MPLHRRMLTSVLFWTIYPVIHLVERWDNWVARLNDAEDQWPR